MQSLDPALSAMPCGCDPGCGWVREDCHVHQVVDGRLVTRTREERLLSHQECRDIERERFESAERQREIAVVNDRIKQEMAAKEGAEIAEMREQLKGIDGRTLTLLHRAVSVERALRSNEIATGSQAGALMAADAYAAAKQATEAPAQHLPTSAAERKAAPIYAGVMMYFPDAIVEVARLSKIGNDQHNPGQPLHWAREKSTDHHDCIMRHVLDAGTVDTDGVRHSTKVAWRALAALQVELEKAKQP